ncbi:phosphomannomutase/phosphoglucomutase [soil metagenome]
MNIPRQVFREYDIRGVAERDLESDFVTALGRAIGQMLGNGERTRVAVGRDCRLSSERLFDALTCGLVEAGINVIDIGVGPTPQLYFAVHHLESDGGIMITGSHNPAEDNGFKIMKGKLSFYGKDIQELLALVESGKAAAPGGGSVETVSVADAYVAAVTAKIVPPTKPMKVVLDAGNGSGGPLGLRCFERIGLSPEALFCDMDGRFPNHHPDPPVEKNVEALIDRVRKTGARVGIAYDGDADRLGAVDETGDIIWGDRLLILFSRAPLVDPPGATILGEVKCSQTLYDDIARHGGNPIMWKTGHSLIKTKMKAEKALLAGEMSGHLFFADRYFGYDDAIYASMRLIELLAKDERPIREMLADIPKTFTTPELRVDCPDDVKFHLVAAITARFKALGNPVIEIDGARITFPSEGGAPAWGLVRASNTGPVLVLRFEAGTEAALATNRNIVESAVREELGKLRR